MAIHSSIHSYLENLMGEAWDSTEAWEATVHGVAESDMTERLYLLTYREVMLPIHLKISIGELYF